MSNKSLIVYISFFLMFSCREKSFEEYDESEFYKTQGIIISAKQTKTILDDPYLKEIKYEYFVNDSLILEDSEDFSFMDMQRGVPIEVLVHKKNHDVSFYWRNGISEFATPHQLEYIQKKMDTIFAEMENVRKEK
ncbi:MULTISPECIES: hypothetical protein [Flavobacteriaceae]|uniref:hypothetical protein n=1 Tax=Flavobacteriaceae TaxID=49546 RepID=UPI002349BA8D|nr:hypothetical protein [Muricauda sp. SP22]MDC6363645.1 hypothetical protein [Muricauda sp. SP22]